MTTWRSRCCGGGRGGRGRGAAAHLYEVLRLFTCAFTSSDVWGLFITLTALLTVGAELEAAIGYPAFWIVAVMSLLAGSVADAAFGALPITQGAAAAVSGIIGAEHVRFATLL